MATRGALATLAVVFCAVLVRMTDADCYLVDTSEGMVDMAEGQYACAATDGSSPLGKHFVQCVAGIVHEGNCSGILRWDIKNSICNWPQFMNCDGKDATTVAPEDVTTPEPTTPKPKCEESNCQLPDCFCYGAEPDMDKDSIPQFIMLSFEDAVNPHVFSSVYLPLLVQNKWELYNPNDCPIRSSFFVSDDHTDYRLIEHLYNKGHEIASHSDNHKTGNLSKVEVEYQITWVRTMATEIFGLPKDSVKGFRAPKLKIYGDVQFEVLAEQNFTYDSSLTNIELAAGRPPLWPFTLDFEIADDRCPNKPCPGEHPGVWEVPLNSWVGNDTYSCSMIDGCKVNETSDMGSEDDFYYFFQDNFERFYEHKVPMQMATHASMFLKSPDALNAMTKFLSDVMEEHDDVWLVTPSQVIDWMQNPVNKAEIKSDSRFGCSSDQKKEDDFDGF